MFGRRTVLALPMVVAFAATGLAQQNRGTPDEAKAMALKAADYLKSKGPEAAFKAFNDPSDQQFHKGDLYVFVIDQNGKELAGPASGQNLKDRPFVQDMMKVQGQGWVNYQYTDPLTHKEAPKTSYIVRVGNDVVGVGAYKPA